MITYYITQTLYVGHAESRNQHVQNIVASVIDACYYKIITVYGPTIVSGKETIYISMGSL